MAAESSRSSSSSADSYIGSLISLTSKSEIRYEGILNNINTEESSIGLRNVRSFGTEGRKKDGPQLMPSHTVYEYILFRGSDIKDLQVKSSLPVQPMQPIHNDPAIIQSHYPQPAPISSSLPAAASNSLPDPSIHNAQMGHPGSTLQGALPLYQPGVNLGSWGPMPPPPNANSSGLAMPMYWPGFYAPPNGIPQLHQQSLVQPAPLSVSPLQQPMQYPSYNASLSSGAPNLPTSSMPDNPSPLLPTSTSSANTTSTSLLGSTLTSSLPPGPPSSLPTDTLPSLTRNKPPNSVVPTAVPLNGGLQSLSSSNTNDVNLTIPPVFDKRNVPSEANLPYQGMSFPISSVARTTPVPTESPTPSLITPGQLLQSGQTVVVSSQFTQAVHKDVEVVQVSPTPPSEPSAPIPVPTEAQPPILPLPPQSPIALKRNGAPYQNHQSYNYRGRDRGRGSGGSRPVVKFTEEFDFNAMNEKFNKDEVWGTLGKSNKFSSKEKDGNASDEDEYEDENDADIPKLDAKPVYSKDDFFDTLSSNSLDNQSNNGRIRFSDQMKLDTETFGEFSRYRGGRIGRGSYRGGRSRGGGYYGRGYSYVGRGRSGRIPYPTRDY